MHVKHAQSCEPFSSGTGETVWELIGKAVGPNAPQHSFALVEIDPGKSSLNHFHPVAEESYFILSGQGEMTLGEETQTLNPGDCVHIPPEKNHQIFNRQSEPLRFIAVCVPPWTPDCSTFV